MNCAEFEQAWQERLDRVGHPAAQPLAPLRQSLADHAARCMKCQRLALGYERLEAALECLPRHATVSLDLTDRVLSAHQRPRPFLPMTSRRLPRATGWAAAAVVLLGLGLAAWTLQPDDWTATQWARTEPNPTAIRPEPQPGAPASPRPVDAILADAASATLALARETSAPAARLSREVMGAATKPIPHDSAPSESSEVLKRLGDGMQASVRPLSRPARHAFGFLVPRLPGPPRPATAPVPGSEPTDGSRGA